MVYSGIKNHMDSETLTFRRAQKSCILDVKCMIKHWSISISRGNNVFSLILHSQVECNRVNFFFST